MTVTVNDGTYTTTESFLLTVSHVDVAPTITPIATQTTNQDTAVVNVPFTVSDADTNAAALSVTATSNTPGLVSNANILLQESGTSRTISITPTTGQAGTAVITLAVSDGPKTTTETFSFIVNSGSSPTTISAISPPTINQGSSTGDLAFTVADTEADASSLAVTAFSSNTSLVPNDFITLGSNGASHTVNVTSAAGQFGSSTITLSVDDGIRTTTRTFQVTVTPVNDPPTISAIADQTTNEDTATNEIDFHVSSVMNPSANPSVSVSSSNQALVPNGSGYLTLGGSGNDRTLIITPADHMFGETTITVSVSDGYTTATKSFVLVVNPLTAVN